MEFLIKVNIAFLVAVLQIFDCEAITYKEVKSDSGSVCDVITNQEGKFSYSGNDSSSACCTIGGMENFSAGGRTRPKFILKSNKKEVKPICCLTPNSACKDKTTTGIRCCNNYKCVDKCKERTTSSGFEVEVNLEKDNCADPKKKYHVKVRVANYTGDACCDTDKIHMITYDDHCCSTANCPYIYTRYATTDTLTPKCCGPKEYRRDGENKKLISTKQQNGNENTFTKPKYAPPSTINFCSDNLSGDYKISKDLSQTRLYFGTAKHDWKEKNDGPQLCCKDTSKKVTFQFEDGPLKIDEYKVCCSSLVDRFREKDQQKKNCCVYSGKCKVDGLSCCKGKCMKIDVESPRYEEQEYGCAENKSYVYQLATEACKK